MTYLVYVQITVSSNPWCSRCKNRHQRSSAEHRRKTLLLFLAVEPREAKPFTPTRKFAERAYILSPPYEGIEHREPAYHRWRSGDCSRIDSPRASRRGARAYGSKRLRKKHSGKGPGRSSGLSCDRWQGIDGRRESS